MSGAHWWGVRFVRFIDQRKKGVRAAFSLVDTIIAEPPIIVVAHIAFPIAFICPCLAIGAERTTL